MEVFVILTALLVLVLVFVANLKTDREEEQVPKQTVDLVALEKKLSSMKKAELLAVADEMGIVIDKSKTKKFIIDKIIEAA